MIKNILFMALAGVMISACSARVDTPGATIRGDGFSVDVNDNDRNHCPPGHAKKGWC